MRDDKAYIQDMVEAIARIEKYTKGINKQNFLKRSMVSDAVVRNLEIMGEASKRMSSETKNKHLSIEWKKIIGLRDILTHAYFGIDLDIIWDIVINKLPQFKGDLEKIKKGDR